MISDVSRSRLALWSFARESGGSAGHVAAKAAGVSLPSARWIRRWLQWSRHRSTSRGTGKAPDAQSNYNGDTVIDTFDFTFISFGFLATGESCSPSFNGPAPRTRVSLKDLRRAGFGDMSAADLNHDGWVDTRDITLFMQTGGGAQPAAGEAAGLGW